MRLESYRGHDLLVRRAFRPLAERPLPRAHGASLAPAPGRAPRRWWWAAAAAAAALLLFVAGATSGWYGRALLAPRRAGRAHPARGRRGAPT